MVRKAIYREFRPQTFDHVYGQDHITSILKNQVESGNIAHAYLFSGTRGTGKTSCAKIFARAINCLDQQEGSPCNVCENCKMSLEDETMDIVEMDAASNRRIDDIRQLRETVVYPPAQLKYRVYIIDEAHMITNEGFNALLKIMEEPPEHLVFILATTEIEKIPQTILSRCQRYEFRRIEIKDIYYNIEKILKELGVTMDENAMELIAIKADGSMRDGLSSLDQVLSLPRDHYTIKDVEDVLGVAEEDDLILILEGFSKRDFKDTLIKFEKASEGKGVLATYEELIEYLQNLMMVKVEMEEFMDATSQENIKMRELASHWSMDEIMTTIDVLLHYNSLLKNSEQPHVIVQVALYKACILEMEETLLDQVATLKRQVLDLKEGIPLQVEKKGEESQVKPRVEDKKEKVLEEPQAVEEKKEESKSVENPVLEETDEKTETEKEAPVSQKEEEKEQEIATALEEEKDSQEFNPEEDELRTPDEVFVKKWESFLGEIDQFKNAEILKKYLGFIEDKFEYNRNVYCIFPDEQDFFVQRLETGENKDNLQDGFEKAFPGSRLRLMNRTDYDNIVPKKKKVNHTEFLKEIFGEDIEII